MNQRPQTCVHKRWFYDGSEAISRYTILDRFSCRCGRRRATGWRGANKIRYPDNKGFKRWQP